jgi:hypothetical protein
VATSDGDMAASAICCCLNAVERHVIDATVEANTSEVISFGDYMARSWAFRLARRLKRGCAARVGLELVRPDKAAVIVRWGSRTAVR